MCFLVVSDCTALQLAFDTTRDTALQSVAGHIEAGQVRSSKPLPEWKGSTISPTAGHENERLERIKAKKRNERITRLLQAREPEAELIKLTHELAAGKDKLALLVEVNERDGAPKAAASATDVVSEDVVELMKVRDAREKLRALRREDAQRKAKKREQERLNRDKLRQELEAQEQARVQLENDLIRVAQEKEAERMARLAQKHAEKQKEEALRLKAVQAYKQRQSVTPLWKKLEQQCELLLLITLNSRACQVSGTVCDP